MSFMPICQMLGGHRGELVRGHVGGVLFIGTRHPQCRDVEEGEHAGLTAVDDAFPEVLKVAPAAGARVRQRRHAISRRDHVRHQGRISGQLSDHAIVGVDMGMYVNQAGSNYQARGIRRLAARGCNARDYFGYLPVFHGDVHFGIPVVSWVDYLPAMDHQIIRTLAKQSGRPEQK
jgi:hypothetical protein